MARKSKISDVELANNMQESHQNILEEIGKVIVGQKEIITGLLLSLYSNGHCLLVGVPGLAKTLLIKTLSQVIDLSFSRIQFTPDLMPSDITGTEILEEEINTGKREFRFVKGPIFANMLLADEINRTPPKTQAALLEAMQEHQVTAAGHSHVLDEPFFVLATQNPIEQEGTYPLPEAQLDRFMFNLNIDYPSESEEINIVKMTTGTQESPPKIIISKKEIIEYQNLVRRVPVAENVIKFAVRLTSQTRPGLNGALPIVNEMVEWGAGPRASQYLILGAKARALLDGRTTPSIEDVIAISKPVLRHRMVMSFASESSGVTADSLIENLITESSEKE
ncbi:MAG: AAA family ATPase [Candidatus Marinimicrobia bacterium]|nr:AAA family ATPase [Candidatus Neomarinimicrobiota bacterium]